MPHLRRAAAPQRPPAVLLCIAALVLVVRSQQPAYNLTYAPPEPVYATQYEARVAAAKALPQSAWSGVPGPRIYATGDHNQDITLTYTQAADTGDRVPDYSHAGYGGGGVPLPLDGYGAPVMHLSPGGDDLARITEAVANISQLPLNSRGFRGVLQLSAGTFNLTGGTFTTRTSGLIIRGAGSSLSSGTVLLGVDTTLFVGSAGYKVLSDPVALTKRMAVGAYSLTVANATGFAVGDRVLVRLNATAEWLASIQATSASDPLNQALDIHRTVVAVKSDTITLDAPTYAPIPVGTGHVIKIDASTMTRRIGFVGLRGIMVAGNPNDGHFLEVHGAVEDFFMKDVVAEYYGQLYQGAGPGSRRFTLEDVVSLHPPIWSTNEPDNRHGFALYTADQFLCHRCSASYSRASFTMVTTFGGSGVVWTHTTDLRSWRPNNYFGAFYPGQLFDLAYSEYAISLDRGFSGETYKGIASTVWNSIAVREGGALSGVSCVSSNSSAINHCIGNLGNADNINTADRSWYVSHNKPVLPSSLYIQQLKERLGSKADSILPQIFFPSQLAGKFRHPTALYPDQFVISGLNTFETATKFNATYALSVYHGNPWATSSPASTFRSWLALLHHYI